MVVFQGQLLVLSPLSAAAGTSALVVAVAGRQNCAYMCGSVCYGPDAVDAAVREGDRRRRAGEGVGRDDYPHRYSNYEGFDLPTAAPWYEFPVLASLQVYDGGAPGPDRVVFDDDGALDALITHTGASGNGFVECERGWLLRRQPAPTSSDSADDPVEPS